VAAIPAPLANAMLAGVLIGLCFAPVKAIGFNPLFGLPIVLAWIVVGAFKRLWAVPAALAAFALVLAFGVDIPEGALRSLEQSLVPTAEIVRPVFNLAGLVSIALPLFIVTMASQNIPGIAVLKVNHYDPKPGPLFAVTGFFSLLSAPFGGPTTNLAAISAAICTGPDVHPDPAERWKTGPFYALAYLVFAIFGASLVAIFAVLPQSLIVLVAGLALMGSLANALSIALKDEGQRMAATVTFVVTASGLTLFGVGAAFWGLVAGLVVLFLEALKKR
jgi:benzoate membrane transport protein